MTILYLLVPIAFVFTGFFVFVFIWAVRDKQFDDLTTPAYRILIQSDESASQNERKAE
jgi:cbb3-type cytochrome oxidase maturation protein